MNYGFSETCLAHETGPRHPENPDRLRAIKEGLKRRHGVSYVEADPVDDATLTAVHEPEYIEDIKAFCANGGGKWDPDTIAVEKTWEAARASAGLAQWAATEALDGARGRQTPFSLGRPPGHHAITDDAMGFCFVNNVAVAAQTALDDGADRVAIVDFDVHHGNGTEEIFYDRPEVFFASVHEAGIYPGSGDPTDTGTGAGEGRTLNIPLPKGAGDAAYQQTIERLIIPGIQAVDPDVLLISAGFDAHEYDPISRMTVSSEGYGAIVAKLQRLATELDIGLGVILEGGYDLEVLASAIGTVHEVFDGYEPAATTDDPDDEIKERIARVADTHPLLTDET